MSVFNYTTYRGKEGTVEADEVHFVPGFVVFTRQVKEVGDPRTAPYRAFLVLAERDTNVHRLHEVETAVA